MALADDLNEVFNQRRVQEILGAIASINEAVIRMADHITGVGDATRKAAEQGRDAANEMKQGFKDAANTQKDLLAESEKALSVWDKVRQGVSQAGGAVKYLSDVQYNATGTFNNYLNQVGDAGPWGRLFQMLVRAHLKTEEFEQSGRKAVMSFMQVQGLSADVIEYAGARVGAAGEKLRVAHIAATGDLEKIMGVAAQGGARIEDAWAESKHAVGEFGEHVATVSLLTDKAFGGSVGSTMQFASALRQNVSTSLDEAVNKIGRMGVMARDLGLTMSMFVGTVNQVTSALRMQGASVDDISVSLLKANDYYEKLYGTQGKKDPRTGQVAAQAVQDIGSFFQNMSDQTIGMYGADAMKKMFGLTAAEAGKIGFTDLALGIRTGGYEKIPGVADKGAARMSFQAAMLQSIAEEAYRQAPEDEGMRFQLISKRLGGGTFGTAAAGIMAGTKPGELTSAEGGFAAKIEKLLKEQQEATRLTEPLTNMSFENVMESVANTINSALQVLIEIGKQALGYAVDFPVQLQVAFGNAFPRLASTTQDERDYMKMMLNRAAGERSDRLDEVLARFDTALETTIRDVGREAALKEINADTKGREEFERLLHKNERALQEERETRMQTTPNTQQTPLTTTDTPKLDFSRARAFLNLDDLMGGGHDGELRIPIITTSSSTIVSGATPDSR